MNEFGELRWQEAIKLIKAAKKLGVISMKFSNLEFELDSSLAPGRAFKSSKKKQAAAASQNLAQLEFDSAIEEVGVMHVEDPSGFERALIENDLDEDASELNEETRHIEA